jgi:hypothetical protein
LLLCDEGGANASNRHVFKEALQNLAQRLDCWSITLLPESDIQQDCLGAAFGKIEGRTSRTVIWSRALAG